jgi:tight adherence protein C
MLSIDPIAHALASTAALALLALAWWAQRLVVATRRMPNTIAVGAESPGWLRLVWWSAQVMAEILGPRLSLSHRTRTLQELQTADLDHVVGPEQWIAARLSLALLAGVVVVAGMIAAQGWGTDRIMIAAVTLVGAWFWSGFWLRERRGAIHTSVYRELPTYLDVLTLGVESGASLSTAMSICVDKSPDSPLRRAFIRTIGEVRAGRTRAEALTSLEQRMCIPAITSLATALAHAERTGASVGQVLRVQADQRSAERFARAEKLAMEAPVKMLGPLILCIFPCTFLVLGFPIVMQLTQ